MTDLSGHTWDEAERVAIAAAGATREMQAGMAFGVPVEAQDEFLSGVMRAVVAAVREQIATEIEAERAEERQGQPGYAVGNWTFNEGLDRAARVVRGETR